MRQCFPEAEIHWVVAKGLRELLEGHPMIDRLWTIDKEGWKNLSNATATLREIKGLIRALRAEKFDLAVDLQGLLRSGLIAAAAKAKTRVGFREAREGSVFFYTHKVEGGKGVHAVSRYLKIASALGCDASEVRFPLLIEDCAPPFSGEYAAIAPGARWETKTWPAGKFGELASMLPIRSVVLGGREDAALAETVVGRSGGKAVSLAGKTGLKGLACIVKNARFMVCNDSGPMHMAAALGTPVYAVFGPTSPALTGPYGEGHHVITGDAACAPCFKKRCADMKCMDAVSVGKVFALIIKNEFQG